MVKRPTTPKELRMNIKCRKRIKKKNSMFILELKYLKDYI